MEQCIVVDVLKYNSYNLKTGQGEMKLCLEFYGVDKPKTDDVIILNKSLLDTSSEEFTQPYAFELVKDKHPADVLESRDKNYILLKSSNKIHVLKRVFG